MYDCVTVKQSYDTVHTAPVLLLGINGYHLIHNGTDEIHFRSLVLVYYKLSAILDSTDWFPSCIGVKMFLCYLKWILLVPLWVRQ